MKSCCIFPELAVTSKIPKELSKVVIKYADHDGEFSLLKNLQDLKQVFWRPGPPFFRSFDF